MAINDFWAIFDFCKKAKKIQTFIKLITCFETKTIIQFRITIFLGKKNIDELNVIFFPAKITHLFAFDDRWKKRLN